MQVEFFRNQHPMERNTLGSQKLGWDAVHSADIRNSKVLGLSLQGRALQTSHPGKEGGGQDHCLEIDSRSQQVGTQTFFSEGS